MGPFATFGVHHDNNFAMQQAKCYITSFAVNVANVLACDSEVVPDDLGFLEIQAMILDVLPTL